MKIEKALFKGGLILVVASGLFGLINFIFQLTMARMLSLSDYGILATLFSIFYILIVLMESIQTVIAKYTVEEKSDGRIKNILKRALRKGAFGFIALFLIYLAVSIPLSQVLGIDYLLMTLNGLSILVVFSLPITRGILQGKKRFGALGTNLILESFFKLAIGVSLVYFGFSVAGALVGNLLGGILAFAFSFLPLMYLFSAKEKSRMTEGIYDYMKPSFVISLVVVAFYSLDTIMAKIVFSAETAGIYAIASIISKAAFWGTAPISKAMFPFSAEGRPGKNNFLSSAIVITSFLLVVLLLIFLLLPDRIISLFSGRSLPESANILIYLGLSMGVLSLTNLILLYKLSLNKVRGYWFLLFFLVIEAIVLFYSSGSLIVYSISFLAVSVALLIYTILFVGN